jgi:hypothetical protein
MLLLLLHQVNREERGIFPSFINFEVLSFF